MTRLSAVILGVAIAILSFLVATEAERLDRTRSELHQLRNQCVSPGPDGTVTVRRLLVTDGAKRTVVEAGTVVLDDGEQRRALTP